MFDAYYEAIVSYAEKFEMNLEDTSILDLGCGRDEFLQYAIEKGLHVERCDFDRNCIEMSSEYAKVFFMDFTKDIDLQHKYDIILISHV